VKPLGRGARRALLVGAAGLALVASITGLHEPDTFFHLAYGRALVRQGGLPAQDPFLWPFAGVVTGAPPFWLGSLVIYLAEAALPGAGAVLLPALLCAGAFALLLAASAPDEGHSPLSAAVAAVPLALALAMVRERAVARPEVIGYLFLAATLWALRRERRGDARALFAFPLLALVWTNVHASVVVGVAVVLLDGTVATAGAALARARGRGAPSIRPGLRVLAVGLAGALATLANPSSLGSGQQALDLARALFGGAPAGAAAGAAAPVLALLKRSVLELKPLAPRDLAGPYGLVLGLAAGSFLVAGRRAALRDALALAGFVALSLGASRFAPLAAIVAAPVTARHLAPAAAWIAARLRGGPAHALAGGALAAAIGGTALLAARPADTRAFGFALHRDNFPVRAVDWLARAGVRGRLFNTFHFGGYLEWRLDGPVAFQDGRAVLHPVDAAAALAGPADYDRFAALDARYRFDALVVQYPTTESAAEAAVMLRTGAGEDWAADRRVWALVAFDDGGLLYLRRDGAYAAEAARDEYRFAYPANPVEAGAFADPFRAAALRRELSRARAEAPECRLCGLLLGLLDLETGRPIEAEPSLAAAVGGTRLMDRYALEALGRAAELRDELDRARGFYRRAMATGVEPAGARSSLALLEARSGRAREAAALLQENVREGAATPDDLALAASLAAGGGRAP
jgi:hypothetical protein